jgi:hypothetical protein
MIYIRISPEQGSEFGIDDPSNLRVRMRLTKQCDCGKRMNDVAERPRLNDQDGFGMQSRRSKLLRLRRFVSHRLRRSRSTFSKQEGGTRCPQRVP